MAVERDRATAEKIGGIMFKIRMIDVYNSREIKAYLVKLDEGKWECRVETKEGIQKIVEYHMNEGLSSEKYINRGFHHILGYQERNPNVDLWINKKSNI